MNQTSPGDNEVPHGGQQEARTALLDPAQAAMARAEQLVTFAQLQKHLPDIPRRTLLRWAKDGTIPSLQFAGRRRLYAVSAVRQKLLRLAGVVL